MDRNVFSQPQVAATIEANYVAVKINADHFPHTCRQYGITALPTDMILTSEGQPVRRFQGEAAPGLYVTRLNEVAAATRRRPLPTYAQRPDVGEPQEAGPIASRPSPPRYEQPNWGGYVNDREAATRPQQQPPQLARAAPRYNDQPVGTRPPAVPPAGRQPEPTPRWSPDPPPASQPSQGLLRGPSGPARVGPPPVARQETPATPRPYVAPAPSSPPPAETASAPQVSEGNPPVGLDGYCPVELCERQRWVLGNRRWGAIHRGRTYLFAGPEEQRRFLDLDAADRYAPVISGDDVVLALDRGQRVAGRRQHGVFFRGQVYLFASEASLEVFAKDPSRYAEQVLQTMRPGRGASYR